MLSHTESLSVNASHPLADYLPVATRVPAEQTTEHIFRGRDYKGYFDFVLRKTACSEEWYSKDDELRHNGVYFPGVKEMAVRGELSYDRREPNDWVGRLSEWNEITMSIVEQGRLPVTAHGWRQITELCLRGAQLKCDNYEAPLADLAMLDNLRTLHLKMDDACHEIPAAIYNLSQVGILRIADINESRPEKPSWSVSLISPDIRKMKSLIEVDLSKQSELVELPDELFDLPNLKKLRIGHAVRITDNQLRRIFDVVDAGGTVDPGYSYLESKEIRELLIRKIKEKGGKIELGTVLHESVSRLREWVEAFINEGKTHPKACGIKQIREISVYGAHVEEILLRKIKELTLHGRQFQHGDDQAPIEDLIMLPNLEVLHLYMDKTCSGLMNPDTNVGW
jgi:hypothetical protein